MSLETGLSDYQAQALLTGIGRFSLPSVERTWSRFNYTARHWNFLGYMNSRTGDAQTSLQSGSATYLDSENMHFEAQTNWDWSDGKVRFVAGLSHREEEVATTSPAGRETLLFAPVDSDSQAAYMQLDFDISDNVKLVLAGRYDDSTLHDSIFSPKGSLVWSLSPHHTLRFGYNEAFQVGNYSEFFLQADVALPLDLAGFELICAAAGVSCGFDNPVRILALGNKNLQAEEVQSLEVGYSGILGGKAYVTIDYYQSDLENFITDLLPNVGTGLGRLNPDFGPYTPPADLPEPFRTLLLTSMQGALGASFFAMSNNLDGAPILGAVSYTNFGAVETEGIDFGLNYSINSEWRLNVSYSWFDFETKEALPGDQVVPNAPETQYSLGLGYVGEKFDASLGYRWTDDFFWSVGTLFRGTVKAYDTVDINANYHITENIDIGVAIANAFDDEAYQSFGGDLVGRRALGHISFRW
jgi:outer membrane receptor protein involved in Fe transport